jgi:hypothetical protein
MRLKWSEPMQSSLNWSEIEDWREKEAGILRSGMSQADTDAAGALSGAVHTLDNQTFPGPRPFLPGIEHISPGRVIIDMTSTGPMPFLRGDAHIFQGGRVIPEAGPSEFIFHPSRSGASYADGRYHIFVQRLAEDISLFADSLRRSWPSAMTWAVDTKLCVWGLAVQLVRYRVQVDRHVCQFTSSGPKPTKIPIFARMIESAANNPNSANLPPYAFDAHVVAAFATQIIAQKKGDRNVSGDEMLKLLAVLAQLDANKTA